MVAALLHGCLQDGGVLQATGEAMYAEDVPVACSALYAAYVTSSTAAARLVSVDWAAALCVPGVAGFHWLLCLCEHVGT